MTIPNKLSARAVAQVKKAWVEGVSINDIAAEHDVTPQTIRYHVKGLAREAFPALGRPRSIDHDRVAELYSKGMSPSLLAERFGVSRVWIWRVAQQARRQQGAAA